MSFPRRTSPVVLSAVVFSLSACAGAAGPAAPSPQGATALLERALPAVVTVAVETDERYAQAFGFGGEEGAARPAPEIVAAYARPLDLSDYRSSGSGFVIERDGRKYVVTNSHVIDQAGEAGTIHVFSVTQGRYPMRLVGADSYRDVAVLAFETTPGSELGAIEIHGANDLRIGMPVYAIGNPLGQFPYTVTSGIISGLNRSLEGLTARDGYLQTDATLIWGNSGGPLLGPGGDVVGLNSRIHLLRQLGGVPAPQINFSLEGSHLNRIVNDILEHGRVQRPFLGVALVGDMSRSTARPQVVLADMIDGTPAARSIGEFDIGSAIRTIAGQEIRTLEEAAGVLENVRPGESVEIGFANGRSATVATETLSPARMDEVGALVLDAFFDTRAEERRDGLYGTSGPRAVPGHMTILDSRLDPARGNLNRAPQPGERIILAGLVGEHTQLWNVNSLHELAIAARLVLGTGSFGVVVSGRDGVRVAVVDLPPVGLF